MADAPASAKGGKGSGLSKKLGPLPLWAWALVGLVVGYALIKLLGSTSSSSPASAAASNAATSTQPASTQTAMGDVPTAGSSDDTGQTTSDLLSSLGAQQEDLLDALAGANSDIVSIAQGQIATAQTATTLGSFNTQTLPGISTMPGSLNAPALAYASPTVITQAPAAAAPATRVAAPPPAKTHYYTYKRDVPLSSGQTVHFKSGSGYYAA